MYKINEEKMFYDMADGVAVVINFTTGIYYAMNELTSAVFDAMMNGVGEAAVLDALQAMEGAPVDAGEQFAALLQKLKEYEVITGDGQGEACPPFASELIKDGFSLGFEEYSEVADLIMADPVHEVEPEMGWPFLKEE